MSNAGSKHPPLCPFVPLSADLTVHLGLAGMSGQRSRGEAYQPRDGAHSAKVQGRQSGRVTKEEVPRQSGLYVYIGVQGGCGAHGGCQSHFESAVLREADCKLAFAVMLWYGPS